MVRSLARVYYYFVFNAMLILAAVGLGLFLSQVLRYTPLNANGTLPNSTELTQALSFAGVFWLVAGLLGGAHYFLIRRDLATDVAAGASGVRSFFLNGLEFVAGWVGVGFAVSGLGNLGTPPPPPDAYSYSPAIVPLLSVAAAAYFVLIVAELERRRTQAGSGAPVVFQRLHFNAIQFVVLGYAASTLASALNTLLRTTIFASTFDTCVPNGPSGQQFCPQVNVVGPWIDAGFSVLLFGLYWLLSRRDTRSALRQVQQLLGLAEGGFIAAFGLYTLLALLLGGALGAPHQSGVVEEQLTVSLPMLLVGLLIAAVYTLWLRIERAVSRMGADATDLAIQAVAAAVPAIFFWVSVFAVTLRVAQILTVPDFQSNSYDWAGPVAGLITGALYIPISLYMRVRTHRTGENGPRRALVLALLAGGTLASAIGIAIVLVTTVTAALNAPLDRSGDTTRYGASLLITGLALAALYGWSLASEHLIGRRGHEPSGQPLPAPAQGQSVEMVLDELLAGQLSREEAAAQVREAVRAGR
jgi:hypothetical protein